MYTVLKTIQRSVRSKSGNAWRDTFISVFVLAGCSLIGLLFYIWNLSEANIISFYILGILLIASLTAHWVYGTISSVVGVILFNCLYAEPRFNFYVYDMQYAIIAIVMLIASLITNYVMTLFRRQLDREKLETRRLDILLETSHHLQQAQNVDDIFDVTLTQLHRMFEQTILLFPASDSDGILLQPIVKSSEEDLRFLPGDWGLDENTWEQFICSKTEAENPLILFRDGKKAVLFKVRGKRKIFAVTGIVINFDKRISGFEHNLILAVLDEVALSLEKYHLHLFNERIAREAEAERLRANLLRSISHDLRTPLTSISGASDILLNNWDQIKSDTRKQLCQNIYDDSEWLINLVENLLFITRIENGVMPIHTEPEVLQEIIPEALNRFAKCANAHNISLEMPEELLVVKIDAGLFIQVIINIVDNAVKHTPSGTDIKVRVFRHGSQAVMEVSDTGAGISNENKQKVFEMFYTTSKKYDDSRRGFGLGLPLCRSIVRAHGGAVQIADNVPCGTVVSFSLYLEEVCFESEYIGN